MWFRRPIDGVGELFYMIRCAGDGHVGPIVGAQSRHATAATEIASQNPTFRLGIVK